MRKTHKEKRIRNKEICQMILSGKTLSETAAHFHLSEGATRHIFRRMEGKLPDKNSKRNKLIHERILSGKSYQQIGNEFGMTKERIRQIHRESGGTISFYKEEKRRKIFEKGVTLAEEFIKSKKYIPLYKDVLQFLLKKNSSTYAKEIYRTLYKKHKNLPLYGTIVEQEKKEKMLGALKQLYGKLKIPLSMSYHLKKYGLESSKSYMYYFGTFKTACSLAGVPSGKRGGNTKERSRMISNSMMRFLIAKPVYFLVDSIPAMAIG